MSQSTDNYETKTNPDAKTNYRYKWEHSCSNSWQFLCPVTADTAIITALLLCNSTNDVQLTTSQSLVIMLVDNTRPMLDNLASAAPVRMFPLYLPPPSPQQVLWSTRRLHGRSRLYRRRQWHRLTRGQCTRLSRGQCSSLMGITRPRFGLACVCQMFGNWRHFWCLDKWWHSSSFPRRTIIVWVDLRMPDVTPCYTH